MNRIIVTGNIRRKLLNGVSVLVAAGLGTSGHVALAHDGYQFPGWPPGGNQSAPEVKSWVIGAGVALLVVARMAKAIWTRHGKGSARQGA